MGRKRDEYFTVQIEFTEKRLHYPGIGSPPDRSSDEDDIILFRISQVSCESGHRALLVFFAYCSEHLFVRERLIVFCGLYLVNVGAGQFRDMFRHKSRISFFDFSHDVVFAGTREVNHQRTVSFQAVGNALGYVFFRTAVSLT